MANKQSRQGNWQKIRLVLDRTITEVMVGKDRISFIIFRENEQDEETEYELCGSCTVDGIVALPDKFGVEVTLSVGRDNLPDNLKAGTHVFRGAEPFGRYVLPIPKTMRA